MSKINRLFFLFFFLFFLNCFEVCSSVVLWNIQCNASFNIISVYIWHSILLVETIGIHGKISLKSLTSLCRFIVIYFCVLSYLANQTDHNFIILGIRRATLKISAPHFRMLKIVCWLLFNAKWAIFQSFHGENKLTFQ